MTEVIDLNGNKKILIEIPNICPYCQKGIKPVIVNSIKENFHEHLLLYVTFKCPICEELFFGKYYLDAYGSKALFEPSGYCFYPSEIIGGNGVEKEFSEEINTVSPNFVKIYNDAFKAEQSNLNSIIGLGYRLSFEYLIKDYCISINSDRCEDIMKMSLSSCIKEFIHDGTKDIFNCTNWLGNDFAHYVTKHPEMKVDDLKKLIDICVSKIEYNIKERNYIEKIKRK